MFERISHAVVAAAGQGTRMWPATKIFPKELFPVGRMPAVLHIVLELVDAGVEDVIIVAGAHNRHHLSALFDGEMGAPAKLASDPIAVRIEEALRRCRVSVIEQTGGYGN